MKTLDLKITGTKFLSPIILIDNKKVKFKINKFGNLVSHLETEKNELELEVSTYHLLKTTLWLPLSLFFFIISFFGLFDLKDENRGRTINYKGKIIPNEDNNNLNIEFNPFKENEIAFNSTGNCLLEANDMNKYYIDNEITKRKKILKYLKLGIFLLSIITTVLIVLF